MTDKEYHLAYNIWKRSYANFSCDHFLEPFLDHRISENIPNGSWIQTIRRSLLLSTASMARRLGISRSALTQIEQREHTGSVTLKTLKQVAKEMDCELIYAIIPKNRELPSLKIWKDLVEQSSAMASKRKHLQYSKGLSIASVARDLMDKPEFRKKLNWTERKS